MSRSTDNLCKCTRTVVDQGQSVCVDCGRVGQRELCTSHTTFEQRFGTLRSSTYTREKRFNNKILGALQGTLLHRLNTNLVRYLKQCEREGREGGNHPSFYVKRFAWDGGSPSFS